MTKMQCSKHIPFTGALVMVLFGCFGCTSDYHSDEEIDRAALKSAMKNMEKTDVRIIEEDPHHVGAVVLNQFLKEFQRSETHYGIRIISYDVLELDFIQRLDSQHFSYAARIQVVPQDRTRFMKIIDGVFPHEDSGDAILFSIKFTLFQKGEMYKLVDIE